MNRRNLMKLMSRALVGAGATSLLPNCATSSGMGGGGALPPATKDNPFVNSLGMKFVPVPGTKILMCTTETTVSQYKASGRGYNAPPFPQNGSHPAVNVSWHDAKAWCQWLSQNEGRRYRIPMDAEWSAAVGGSTYPWGNQWPPPNNAGNYSGQEMRRMTASERQVIEWVTQGGVSSYPLISGFSDRHKFTAPVGSYPVNQLGLHDLGGNVAEWCQDACQHLEGRRLAKGGSWHYIFLPKNLASSHASSVPPDDMDPYIGFRCVIG